MMRRALWAVMLLAACGEDDEGGGPRAGGPAGPAAGAQKPAEKAKLQPRTHVEERIRCPLPDKPDGPECRPEAATCDEGKWCLSGFPDGKSYCEPCPERDSIRHEFRERDFVAEQSRDPFQSFVIVNPNVGPESKPQIVEATRHCTRNDQFIAQNYSYQDLKLVGIVSQGTQRKVLMMDSANLGHIIKRGDCVGKEKAVVKDIGTGYVTFAVDGDPSTKRPPTETSVQLHPMILPTEGEGAPEQNPPAPAPRP